MQARPEPVEAQVLRQAVGELLVLLGEGDGDGDGDRDGGGGDGTATDSETAERDSDRRAPAPVDPLEELVGLTSGEVARPTDPAVARLLPDAYGDDPEAAADFRRYTESDLRAGKRANATVVLTTLPEDGAAVVLDRDQCDAWLGCLNDLRLVLGTRLEVDEETDLDGLAPEDPRGPALQVYGWLGWLQESLISCLTPRH